jgi:hypothetical protein
MKVSNHINLFDYVNLTAGSQVLHRPSIEQRVRVAHNEILVVIDARSSCLSYCHVIREAFYEHLFLIDWKPYGTALVGCKISACIEHDHLVAAASRWR